MFEISWDDVKFNAPTDDEMSLLNLFHEKFIQISEFSFIKNGTFKSSFELQLNKEDGVCGITFQGPQEEEISSILLFVRSIKLQNDKTNIRIERILRILENRSANDKTKQYLQSLIRSYKDKSNKPHFTLRGPNPESIYKDYSEDDIFDLWINGYYFHNDLSKRQVLDDLMDSWPLMRPAVKEILIKIIIDSLNWAWIIDTLFVNAILPSATGTPCGL